MEIIKALKDFPLLSQLDDNELTALSNLLIKEEFEKGMNIITENDIDKEMYLLISGTVDVIKTTIYGDKFVCATLDDKMHCVFGEMALIDNDKRSATVLAKTNCMTLKMDSDAFNLYCTNYPKAGISLLKLMNINLIRNLRAENENLRLVYQALIEEIESN